MIQVTIAILGASLAISAFLLAIYNMSRMTDDEVDFKSIIKTHLTSMAMMVIGSVMGLVGLIWYLVGKVT